MLDRDVELLAFRFQEGGEERGRRSGEGKGGSDAVDTRFLNGNNLFMNLVVMHREVH